MERTDKDGKRIPKTGLTVVVEPEKPYLDVVFVHGFTGHPVRTWLHKKGDVREQGHEENELQEPPRKTQKLNPFSSSRKPLHGDKYWPQDLVPNTLPDARVLTYGYDTRIRHKLGPPVSQDTVYDIAGDFLVALEAERRVEPSRPVLFIAHSLGGIVVKEMLRRLSDGYRSQPHLRHIFTSTIGLMFFGTPHSGADPRGIVHRVAERIFKGVGFSVNEHIVNSLLPSAERLKELRDDFGPTACQQEWIIYSFQEQYGVAFLMNQKVVEDTSSCLHLTDTIETTQHIGRDHMEMCRFTGPDDGEFKKVASALRRMTDSLSPQIKREETLALSDEQRSSLLESLRFDQIDARRMTIKKAHTKTCIWLLKKAEYRDWLDTAKINEHHGFLWIRGKPGTGKSTLMKFLLANAKRTMRDRIVISFFFNARGEGLEMSTLGMYQSLLLQLLERLPALQSVFDSLYLSARGNSAKYPWNVQILKTLLEEVILSLGDSSVVCLIDALDECDEGQIGDMTSFFEHVGELTVSASIRFQVCFSSRHYPNISIQKEIRFHLEGQEGHTQDIISYLDSELRIGHDQFAEQVRIDVQEKASGIFLWVVLVVEILNKEYRRGRKQALRRRVHDIPGDLHELFRDILTRDFLHREELVLCVQCVLFARQPLKPEQLYHAILSVVEPQDLPRWKSDGISISDITRRIIDASKGLAEITTSKTPTVQFIHQSLKDFFLRENGLNRIWPELGDNFQGQGHEQLKRCCTSYVQFYMKSGDILYKDLPKASTPECKALRESVDREFPFLEYAVRHVLYHADSAEGCNISQMTFIQSFPLGDWLRLDNLFEKNQVRRHTQNASLLYILAEKDMPNLIRIHPSNLTFLEIEDERYGFPLLASLATGSESAVKAFLAALAASQSPGNLLQELCSQYAGEGGAKGKVGRNFKFLKHDTALSCIAANGDKTLLEIVFALQRFDIKDEPSNRDHHTLLCLAASMGYEPLVKQLLERESTINTKGIEERTLVSQIAANGHEIEIKQLLDNMTKIDVRSVKTWTPLSQAAGNGHETVVELLLENGAEVGSKAVYGKTPLSYAASNGHELVVKLLIENEAKVDSRDEYDQTPLARAASNGHRNVVKLLLESGKVDVDSKHTGGETPLSHAASKGRELVVKLLLETGKVDVDSKHIDGGTPLSHAASNGRELVVKLLLETGKADVDSKDNDGRTPLWFAASHGNFAIVKMLLETGKVDVNSMSNERGTPLVIAASNGHELIVKLLLEMGEVEVNARDKMGHTPLWWAAYNGNLTIVKLLLETGKVDVYLADVKGRTPRDIAAEMGHKTVVDFLDDYNQSRVKW